MNNLNPKLTGAVKEKLAGKKGGLTKEINKYKGAGQPIPPDLQRRMDEITKNIELASQATLVTHRKNVVRDLEAISTSFSHPNLGVPV